MAASDNHANDKMNRYVMKDMAMNMVLVEIPEDESDDFNETIKKSGNDPMNFKAEMREDRAISRPRVVRRIVTVRANSNLEREYDASGDGTHWNHDFAIDLKNGLFDVT
jgi:hypothetical protein